MEICFNLSEEELSEKDRNLILTSIGVEPQDKEALVKIAKCAMLEYKKMFIEKGLPTKAAEVMQERLFYLIKGYYENRLPTEQEISNIFQLTASGSKTLLKNTVSRNRIYLQKEINQSIKNVLITATQDSDKYYLVIQSETIKDEINLILTQKKPTLKKLIAVPGSAGQYQCPQDTMIFLREEFNLNV